MTISAMQAYRDECIAALNAVDLEAVAAAADALLVARDSGCTVFIAGNGGSAATASHMATDLMLGSQLVDPPLRVIALRCRVPPPRRFLTPTCIRPIELSIWSMSNTTLNSFTV
jgi:phosphoheptose isomerase